MKFRSKIIFAYFLFILFFIILFEVYIYYTNNKHLNNRINDELNVIVSGVQVQVDTMIEQMDYVLVSLVSRKEFLDAISSIKSSQGHSYLQDTEYLGAREVINLNLYNYFYFSRYQGVIFLSEDGYFFSSNYNKHKSLYYLNNKDLNSIDWYKKVYVQGDKKSLLNVYKDPFSKEQSEVFGLVRVLSLMNGQKGILMVQQNREELDKIFEPFLNSDHKLFIEDNNGGIFYKTSNISDGDIYNILEENIKAKKIHSSNNQLTYYFVPNYQNYSESYKAIINYILVSAIVILILAFIFNIIISQLLTKPINQIVDVIREYEYDNESGFKTINSEHDEMNEINYAFSALQKRLNRSVQNEVTLGSAWLQARFDSLQEQINPHFINNMLTVISNRGLIMGDEYISEICDHLAQMLRYSTSTKRRDATIREEIDHVKTYLELMRTRLGEKLSYTIDISEELYEIKLPKIVFQQFIENSLEHGFKTVNREYSITLSSNVSNDHWTIELWDNGQGIPKEMVKQINLEIEELKKGIDKSVTNQGLQIGGMGLTNTFLRLYLFFGEKLIWQLNTEEDKGTGFIIGAFY